MRSLPLVVGNTWTYKNAAGQTVTVAILGTAPGRNAAGQAVTEIRVKELFAGRTTTTAWACTPGGGLTVPPDSFFFSGEPGGAVGVAFANVTNDQPWLPADAGLTVGAAWVEKVRADATRADAGGQGAQHAPGRVELERHVVVQPVEQVALEIGHFGAQKLAFDLRGRGVVEDQRYELPVKRPGAFWLVRGVGIVKLDDAFDRTWELASTNVPLPRR